MYNLAHKSAHAARAAKRLAAGMATAAPRIGDTKVAMSLFEKDAFINYQRIEDNLAVVRDRCVSHLLYRTHRFLTHIQVKASSDPLRKDCLWTS